MTTLALDISTRSTGWFVDENNCGLIKINEKLEFPDKLVFFRKELAALIKKYKPRTIVMEDVHYRRGFSNIHTVKVLAKFGGVATELAASKKAKVVLMSATLARKALAKKGKVTKEDVFEHFNLKFKMDWSFKTHNDVTDAWMLHFAYESSLEE